MSFNLKDFFAGIVYLFVIFLPGASFLLLLVCVFSSVLSSSLFGMLEDTGTAGMALVFFGLSYFIGHLVSLVSSTLEDSAWKVQLIKARRKGLDKVSDEMRALVKLLLNQEVRVCAIDAKGDNLRSWCRIILRKDSGPLDVDVERKDADRRFFRNILLVLTIGTGLFFWKYHSLEEVIEPQALVAPGEYFIGGVILLALTLISYFRYEDQDGKYTKLLFTSYLALRTQSAVSSQPLFTHAGAVVYRMAGTEAALFLITRPRDQRDEWVLPKGHIECKESPDQAARREIAEEVGVEADILAPVDLSRYKAGDEVVTVIYFLAKYKGETDSDENRETRWESLEAARDLLTYPEARMALEKAAKLIDEAQRSR